MQNDIWISKLKKNPINWMLESNPWTCYCVLTDILELPNTDKEVIQAKEDVLKHELVQNLKKTATDWMPKEAGRNSDPKISYFPLRILAEFGLNKNDPGIMRIISLAEEHTIDDLYACRGHIPKRTPKGEKFVKPDPYEDVWHVVPCNSPMITLALAALGYKNDQIEKSINKIARLWESPEGWFCHLFFVESQFKREKSGCPMAGLMALDLFSYFKEIITENVLDNAYSAISYHTNLGKSIYYFGRSKKFWTLKYPFVWYNALYLADVLSRYPKFHDTKEMRDCINWILDGQNSSGQFTATSIFRPYKEWDFGQKREPSPWLTYVCCRILKRYFSE